MYAPVTYWWQEMVRWIRSRSYADCHKFINEHDDELVREVLKFILRHVVSSPSRGTAYTETALQWAQDSQFNASREIVKDLSLTPKYISSTPYTTFLRQHRVPKQFRDEEVFSRYNVCKTSMTKTCARCNTTSFCSAECQKSAFGRSSTRRRARRRQKVWFLDFFRFLENMQYKLMYLLFSSFTLHPVA